MKPLTLALTGLEDEDVTEFRRVFGKLRGQLDADWRLTDADDADLIVVDIDSIHGHMDWLKLTGSGMRTAVYTSAQYAKEAELCLFKPLASDNLADILNAVSAEPDDQPQSAHAEMQAEHPAPEPAQAGQDAPEADEVETAPAAAEAMAPAVEHAPAHAEPRAAAPEPLQAAEPEPEPEPEYEPEAARAEPRTVGEWLLLGPMQKPARIEANGESWLIDPDRDVYHGPATLKPITEALEQPLEALNPVDVKALEMARKSKGQPLSRLRWYAGLTSSPGTLDEAIAGATSFKLKRWPQIEREFPRHFRIATAMMKQAGSVAELASASGAPQGDVADFINASHAVGIVELGGVEADEAPAPQRGRMMSRLRSSLGR